MELHNRMQYKGGETIRLGVDDCGWIFINNRKAVDLGGEMAYTQKVVLLDTLADKLGIVKNGTYNIDIFYAERWCAGAAFILQTDISILDKQAGTPVIKGAPGAATGEAGIRCFLGAAALVLPARTTAFSLALYSCTGKRVWRSEAKVLPGQSAVTLTPPATLAAGVYVARATCQNANKAQIAGVAGKLVLGR